MANAALVQVKVDKDIKEDVSKIYENLGLDLPTAIRIFLRKALLSEDFHLIYEMIVYKAAGIFIKKLVIQYRITMYRK